MNCVRVATLLLLCALFAACTQLPSREAATASYLESQKGAARQLQADGRLAESLALWQSLAPLRKNDPESEQAIGALQAEINTQVQANLRKAKQAYVSGRTRDGDTYMLRVLALDPGNAQALSRLAGSKSARAQARQKSKTDEEYRISAQRVQSAPGGINQRLVDLHAKRDYPRMIALAHSIDPATNPQGAELLRSAHIALADRAEKLGNLDSTLAHLQSAMALQPLPNDPLTQRSAELRKQLSRNWYQQGSRLMQTDLAGAIVALEKSLQYNPYNDDAKRKLLQAQTLQRNLERIESRR